ncbi:MAG: hypothetical protein QJR08_04270 [Bacillota bacterium]|nr:hypothetical protein [Bacillota bacterium]
MRATVDIAVRYGKRCARCGRYIRPGELAEYSRETKELWHPTCAQAQREEEQWDAEVMRLVGIPIATSLKFGDAPHTCAECGREITPDERGRFVGYQHRDGTWRHQRCALLAALDAGLTIHIYADQPISVQLGQTYHDHSLGRDLVLVRKGRIPANEDNQQFRDAWEAWCRLDS